MRKNNGIIALTFVAVSFGLFLASCIKAIVGSDDEWNLKNILITLSSTVSVVALLDYYFIVKNHPVLDKDEKSG